MRACQNRIKRGAFLFLQFHASRWTVRESAPEDFADISELFTIVFGLSRPLAHSFWKFRDNPAGPSIGVVAVDSGRIVGQYALMPTRLRLGADVVLGAQSLDTMTHPDYRKQGMFIRLARECYELAAKRGIEALYGFSNPLSHWGLVQDLNWDHVADIPRWVRFIRPGTLTSIPDVLKPIGALVVRARASLLPKGNSSPRGIEVRLQKPSDNDVEMLLEGWRNSEGSCRVERSMEWYRWRFDPTSRVDYRWAIAYRDGHAQAWAVWGTHEWGKNRAMIDLMGCDPEALEAVTAVAVREAVRRGLSHILAITNVPLHIKALKSCGFTQSGTIPLIVRSMTARNLGGNIHDPASWRVSTADADTF